MTYIIITRSGIAYGPFQSREAAGHWAVAKDLAQGWKITSLYTAETV